MKISRFGFAGLAVALAASLGACATSPAPNTAQFVSQATHGQVQFQKTFAGPSAHVQGVIGSVNGRKVLFWVVDHKFLVPQSMLDAHGVDLTAKAAQDQGLVPKPASVSETIKAIKGHGFMVGRSGPLLVAFEDPNCSACHYFTQNVQSLVASGRLRIYVVPVGFVRPDSAMKAQALLDSHDPQAAWVADEANFDMAHEEGGMQPARVVDANMKIVEANRAILQRAGRVATPAIVYCARADKAPQITFGFSPGMLSNLGSVSLNGGCAG